MKNRKSTLCGAFFFALAVFFSGQMRGMEQLDSLKESGKHCCKAIGYAGLKVTFGTFEFTDYSLALLLATQSTLDLIVNRTTTSLLGHPVDDPVVLGGLKGLFVNLLYDAANENRRLADYCDSRFQEHMLQICKDHSKKKKNV